MHAKAPGVTNGGAAMLATNGDHFFVPSVSPGMRSLERTVMDIAVTEMPVLIIGESGTGKGAVAYRIHQISRRSGEAFLKLSCAALDPEFFSSHLPANGEGSPLHAGTVFLDEVGELESACQPRLLYALPDSDVAQNSRMGARLISATRRNLEKEMRSGRFREDLYYRLNGVCLRLPTLRQRREDIPALAEHFLMRYAALLGRRKPELSESAMRILLDHAWPGNIRELEHAMQKVVALGDERLALEELHSGKTAEAGPEREAGEMVSLKQAARAASRRAERELILKVLSRTRWNRKRAAQELQISYKALLYKLKQIGLDSAGT